MKKLGLEFIEISSMEYEALNDTTRVPREDVTATSLMNTCEYLKNKKVLAPYEIKYPREKFIDNMIKRVHTAPDYIPSVKELLESDYFSNIMKESIYRMTSTIPNCERINRLLKGDLHMNKFPASQLAEIRSIMLTYILHRQENSEYAMNSYIGILHLFNDYMFILDGLGPVNYIKSHFDKDTLAREILSHSGLAQKRVQNCNRVNRTLFNENHILSVYQKIEKYMPWATDDFITMIESMKNMSPLCFVNSFYEFVDNGYSIDNLDMLDDNISFDDISEYDEGEQAIIKRSFLENVSSSSKVLKLTNNLD